MAKDRPHKDKHDEEIRELAATGTREELQEAVDEAVARDKERNHGG